jgi:WD40 repeat protein
VVSFFVREFTRIFANPNPIRADLRRFADRFLCRDRQPRLTVAIPDDLLALGKQTATYPIKEKDMNKRIIILSASILIMVQIFLLSSCGNPASNANLETETPSSTPSPQPSATTIPTSTPSPTLTPTPIPVTIQEAIQRGTFAELEVFNKGRIYSRTSQGSNVDEIIRFSTFSPDGQQFVAVTKRGIYAYDVKSWQELVYATLSPEVTITSIGFSVDSSLFAAGDSSGVITLWNIRTWEMQNSFQVHKGAVTSLDISPDNMNFVTIGDKKEISVWDMSDGSLIKSQFRSKDSGPAYYSLDGKWLYISEAGGNLIVWSSEDLTLTNRLAGLGFRPPEQAVSPYTNAVAAFFAYSASDTITVYDFDKQETSQVKLDKRYTNPTQMTFLDEKTLMVKFLASDDYFLVDLESHAFTTLSLEALSKKTFKNPEFLHILKSKEIKALGFEELGSIQNITPDGTALILSGSLGYLSGVFDLNEKTMKKVSIQEFPWNDSVFLSDGSLAGVDWARLYRRPPFSDKEQQGEFTITLLDPESQFAVKSKIKQNYDLPDYIDTAAISPNEKLLAAGTADGNLYLWNLEAKELITTIRAHNKEIYFGGIYYAYSRLFFDEDSSHLATWGEDGKIKVFDMEDLSEITSVNGELPVFSPDGSHLAYVSTDGSIRLVSFINEEAPKVFRGNINKVSSIAFSVDGTLLFSGDYNNDWSNPNREGKLKVWSISDETLLLDLPQYNSISLRVSPDGTRLYVHDGDGIISVWGHQEK